MAQPTQTRRIIIKVDTQGSRELKAISDSLGDMNKTAKNLSRSFDFITASFAGFLGGLSIRSLIGFSDEIQNLNNRLVALTGSQVEASRTLSALTGIARETNQSITAVSESYLRMSQALKDANISQDTMLELTKTISNTFRLSGASTEEAANATIQLGQAFSLGTLRGQDLRSVMSQNLVLTRLLRNEFGTELLKAAEKGLITVPKLMEIIFKNMEKVNEQAKLMSATFEQSATKGLDAFKLKIAEVSAQMNAAGIFGSAMDFVIKNIGAFVTGLTILAVAAIPAVIAGLAALFGPISLIVVGLTTLTAVLGGLVVYFTGNTFDIAGLVAQFQSGFEKIRGYIDDFRASVITADAAIYAFLHGEGQQTQIMRNQAEALKKSAELHRINAEQILAVYRGTKLLAEIQKKKDDDEQRRKKDLANARAKFDKNQDPEAVLSKLNKAYEAGTISLEKYNEQILKFYQYKAKYQFLEGKKDLGQRQDTEKKVAIFELNQELRKGIITLEQYDEKIKAIQLKDLRDDLEAGRISLADFNSKLAGVQSHFDTNGAFRTGLQDYVKAIGSTTQQVAGAITDAFKGLEDTFVEFIKNGKFNFDKFTEAILEDLTRIIVRASIVQPLANGLLQAFSSPGTTGYTPRSPGQQSIENAHGNVFDISGLRKFAKGGAFVDKPTVFAYGKGGVGVMGEKGPEAILPLSRGSNGSLGVSASVTPVNINIINQAAGHEVTQTERMGPNGEKTLDIIVQRKVREGIASGTFDRDFKNSFGINRKGS